VAFKNAKIAILEARMSGEMAALIRRYGGIPVSAPAVRESALESQKPVSTFIDHLTAAQIQTVVFFTGVGVNTLFKEAERLGRLPELLAGLHTVTIVCRGPKPSAPLRKQGIPIALSAREPFTTTELLEELAHLDVAGTQIGIVHYGERNEAVGQYLQERGARLDELSLYEWLLPADITPLENLIADILAVQIDAIVFTSQVQARHLLLIAERMDLKAEVIAALNNKTIVASVGPTCSGVLKQYGVIPHVEPEHPKMGHLIKTLAEYMGV
jgi:uroporphyrinogen-III synthase